MNVCIQMSLHGENGEILDVPFAKVFYSSVNTTYIDNFNLKNKPIGKV